MPNATATIPLYEKLLTEWHNQQFANHENNLNLAKMMMERQAESIVNEKLEAHPNSDTATLDWCLSNWDNHNQYVRYTEPSISNDSDGICRCASSPVY